MPPFVFSIKVWVLDATPGRVRPGGHGEDRPGELIAFLSRMPKQVSHHQTSAIDREKSFACPKIFAVVAVSKVSSKREVVEALLRDGFSADVSQVR